jgi:hypothetical protein
MKKKKNTQQINLDMTTSNDVTVLSTDIQDNEMSDAKSILSASSIASSQSPINKNTKVDSAKCSETQTSKCKRSINSGGN